MKRFFRNAVLFWFVLLVLAFINAIIRETTYKPFLTPFIGMWAHQISSLTGILLFFGAIYVFLKRQKSTYTQGDLVLVGIGWIIMTMVFETGMNIYVRKLSLDQVLSTYYFWNGDTWIFVLLSLLVSPQIADRLLEKHPLSISKNKQHLG